MTNSAIANETVLRAEKIYSMNSKEEIFREIAIRENEISSVSSAEDGLQDLVSQGAKLVNARGLFILPGLIDTHTHLLQAAYAVYDAQIDNVKSIREIIDLVRERASSTPEGTWIRSSAAWHEMNLAEKRFPTAAELDEATSKHPVVLKRGGHNDVVNSLALKISGI